MSLAPITQWGSPSLWLRKRRESEMPAPLGFGRVSKTKSTSTHSIAAYPFDKLRAGTATSYATRFAQSPAEIPPPAGEKAGVRGDAV